VAAVVAVAAAATTAAASQSWAAGREWSLSCPATQICSSCLSWPRPVSQPVWRSTAATRAVLTTQQVLQEVLLLLLLLLLLLRVEAPFHLMATSLQEHLQRAWMPHMPHQQQHQHQRRQCPPGVPGLTACAAACDLGLDTFYSFSSLQSAPSGASITAAAGLEELHSASHNFELDRFYSCDGELDGCPTLHALSSLDLPSVSASIDATEQSAADCNSEGSLSQAAALRLLPPQLVAAAADVSRTVVTLRRSLEVVTEDLQGEQQAGDDGAAEGEGQEGGPATLLQQQAGGAGMAAGACEARGVIAPGSTAAVAPVWQVERNILNQHFKGVTIYCGWN